MLLFQVSGCSVYLYGVRACLKVTVRKLLPSFEVLSEFLRMFGLFISDRWSGQQGGCCAFICHPLCPPVLTDRCCRVLKIMDFSPWAFRPSNCIISGELGSGKGRAAEGSCLWPERSPRAGPLWECHRRGRHHGPWDGSQLRHEPRFRGLLLSQRSWRWVHHGCCHWVSQAGSWRWGGGQSMRGQCSPSVAPGPGSLCYTSDMGLEERRGRRPRKQMVEAAQVSSRNFGVVEPVIIV